MKEIYTTKTLVAKSSKGLDKFWRGFVCEAEEAGQAAYYTRTESWQTLAGGGESVHQVSAPRRIEAKNVGRANETAPREQAIAEITSEMNKKLDKGYWPVGEERQAARPLPMLAHAYDKRAHDITYPAYVQPKLDGFRCLSDGAAFWTRMGKDYLADVVAHLKMQLPEGVVLDGELMLPHDRYTFQESAAAIKKFRPGVSPDLQYFVYDMVDEARTFEERHARLKALFDAGRLPGGCVLVETHKAKSEEEMRVWEGRFIEAGYEGLMIRNAQGLYKTKDRSKDLQKVKQFQDHEFEIVGVNEGVAKEEGCAVFVCRSPFASGDDLFSVRPRGTEAERRKMYAMREQLIGQKLKVRYQNLSDTGIPRFPVGIALREAWDMSPSSG